MKILFHRIKFIILYKLYRLLNGLALECYDSYWKSLKYLESKGIK
jgi:hypothetical protein